MTDKRDESETLRTPTMDDHTNELQNQAVVHAGLYDELLKENAGLHVAFYRLKKAFYYAWSRRPLLGKQWDGESDPLALTLEAMDKEAGRG